MSSMGGIVRAVVIGSIALVSTASAVSKAASQAEPPDENPIYLPSVLRGVAQAPSTRATATPTATATGTPASTALPELAIERAWGCMDPHRPTINACVRNQGAVAAGAFWVGSAPTAEWWLETLASSTGVCLAPRPFRSPVVVVDVYDDVAESDESNNLTPVAVPSAWPTCEATPTP